jgi:hypothetical protein
MVVHHHLDKMRLTEFERTLDRLEYPTTTERITSEFGGQELQFQDGSARVDQVIGRFGSETFTCADELRTTLYGALPGEAIGRKGYTDRDPPGLGEFEHVSF